MKKVYLQEIIQYNDKCYIGKIDPRELVRVATKIEIGETQTAQRPLNGKRIKDIAKYVGNEHGILPSTLTLATNNNSFELKKDSNNIFYIEFPETDEEFKNYINTIDVMDGQHRLYSFDENIQLIDSNAKYEIGFTLYFKPTILERQKIFVVCNEKQEKVSGNLLMWFRDKLKMLSENEKRYYMLVDSLNNNYPLQGRIIMGAEKVKNGIKAKELMKIIEKSKLCDLSIKSKQLSDEEIIKIVSTYLSAWEKAVGFSFSKTSKVTGPATKISGLRFMLFTLQAFWDRAISTRAKFNEEFVVKTISLLAQNMSILREEFFTDATNKQAFMERSQTEKFAETCSKTIKNLDNEDFNPLG